MMEATTSSENLGLPTSLQGVLYWSTIAFVYVVLITSNLVFYFIFSNPFLLERTVALKVKHKAFRLLKGTTTDNAASFSTKEITVT